MKLLPIQISAEQLDLTLGNKPLSKPIMMTINETLLGHN